MSTLIMLSAGAPRASAAQPYSPNQYAGQAGYAPLLQSCRWYADWLVALTQYGNGQPGVWNADQARYNLNQNNEAHNAYVAMGSPGYGADTPDYGSYWIWSSVVYLYFNGYSSYITTAQLQQSAAAMDTVCASVFPQQGSSTDYLLNESRWSACNGPITWSTTGPDPTWQLNQLASITGLDIEQVPSGGMIQYSWNSSNGGLTQWYSSGAYFSTVYVQIGSNQSAAGIQATLYHESGHAIGLGHGTNSTPPGSDEMMYWTHNAQTPAWINYGNGDIAGAEAIGIAAGC
jgi:hypothetical protein